jgi:copper chaperone CopZ
MFKHFFLKKITLIIFAFFALSLSVNAQSEPKKEATKATFETSIIEVSGNCGQCKERIETAVDVAGVRKAVWSPKTGKLTITYKPEKISLEKIEKLIAAAGHDTKTVKADTKTYESLPGCCQYREGNPHSEGH